MAGDRRRGKEQNLTERIIDYNACIITTLKNRRWQKYPSSSSFIQPDILYHRLFEPPVCCAGNPSNGILTRFVRSSTNKYPIFTLSWTPDGRRLITGASSGQFTLLWNGLDPKFKIVMQAHAVAIRCLKWSHTGAWMASADQDGFVKYWRVNMKDVHMYQAHRETIRDIGFSPTDAKLVTCSDDSTVRIWDFESCQEERVLRGHDGAHVRCVAWHPTKGLLASGSKDSQQPIKLWDPRNGKSLCTLYAHKASVTGIAWNEINGRLLATCSRDHLAKIFDLRNLSKELVTLRGHKNEVSTLKWHPLYENMLVTAGGDGKLMYWLSTQESDLASVDNAHDGCIWALDFHPLAHILVSGSNDHSTKFWTRNRPGDTMKDKYNLNILQPPSEFDLLEYETAPEPQTNPSSYQHAPGASFAAAPCPGASAHPHQSSNDQAAPAFTFAPLIAHSKDGDDEDRPLPGLEPVADADVPETIDVEGMAPPSSLAPPRAAGQQGVGRPPEKRGRFADRDRLGAVHLHGRYHVDTRFERAWSGIGGGDESSPRPRDGPGFRGGGGPRPFGGPSSSQQTDQQQHRFGPPPRGGMGGPRDRNPGFQNQGYRHERPSFAHNGPHSQWAADPFFLEGPSPVFPSSGGPALLANPPEAYHHSASTEAPSQAAHQYPQQHFQDPPAQQHPPMSDFDGRVLPSAEPTGQSSSQPLLDFGSQPPPPSRDSDLRGPSGGGRGPRGRGARRGG